MEIRRASAVFMICLVLVLASSQVCRASYQRISGLTGGISGVAADDTDFDSVNVAKLARLSKIKYIGDYYAENDYHISSDSTTDKKAVTRDSLFDLSNFLLIPLSPGLKVGIKARPQNEVAGMDNQSIIDQYFYNDSYWLYGLLIGFEPAAGTRLGLSVVNEDRDVFSKLDGFGSEISDVFEYNGTLYEMGVETDLSADEMIGAQVRYEVSGGGEEFRASAGSDYDSRYSNNDLFGMSLNGERRINASTVMRGVLGFNNINKPYVREEGGSEYGGGEFVNSNFITLGLEFTPAAGTVVAAGFQHRDGADITQLDPDRRELVRDTSDCLFAGVESPVPGIESLTLRGSVKGAIVSSAERGNTWSNDDAAFLTYYVGLGWRVYGNVLVDIAANSAGSVPFDSSTDSYSYRDTTVQGEELSGAPQVTLAITIDG